MVYTSITPAGGNAMSPYSTYKIGKLVSLRIKESCKQKYYMALFMGNFGSQVIIALDFTRNTPSKLREVHSPCKPTQTEVVGLREAMTSLTLCHVALEINLLPANILYHLYRLLLPFNFVLFLVRWTASDKG